MRVSTGMIYELGIAGIQRQQSSLLTTQQQLSTGRKLLTPADDPVASAQALQITQADEINTQFSVNRNSANAQLQLTDAALSQVSDLLQNIRQEAVNAGSGALTDADRASLANDLGGMLQQLIGIANSTDAQGQYLFSGFQAKTLPFLQTAAGVQFSGDDGQRLVQVGPTRQIPGNASGADVFQRIRNGNGVFTWSAAAANTGSVVIGPGSVANPALLTGHDYQINFTSATTYDVIDTTAATTVLAAQPYTGDAASVAFDGIVVNLHGLPATGDSFSVVPSTDQSLFTTVQNLVTLLNTSVSGPAVNAQLATGLGLALTNLDQSLGNVLARRVTVGSNMRELDSLDSAGQTLGVEYQDARSRLQDLDYAKAVSDLASQQLGLEAAEKSFARITGLSLFDYL